MIVPLRLRDVLVAILRSLAARLGRPTPLLLKADEHADRTAAPSRAGARLRLIGGSGAPASRAAARHLERAIDPPARRGSALDF